MGPSSLRDVAFLSDDGCRSKLLAELDSKQSVNTIQKSEAEWSVNQSILERTVTLMWAVGIDSSARVLAVILRLLLLRLW